MAHLIRISNSQHGKPRRFAVIPGGFFYGCPTCGVLACSTDRACGRCGVSFRPVCDLYNGRTGA